MGKNGGDRFDQSGPVRLDREPLEHSSATSFTHLTSQFRVTQQPLDAVSQTIRILRGDDDAGFVGDHDLAHTSGTGCDNGQAPICASAATSENSSGATEGTTAMPWPV